MAEDFEKAFAEYQETVRRFLMRLTRHPDLAEELTQETFYQALRHWKSFRGDCSVSTWLCTIAKRQYLNCLRRAPELPLEHIPEPGTPDITDALIDSDRQMAAHRLLHQLPEPFREVFTLRTFGGLDHRQIGSLFGKSDAWSRQTYYRARQMLTRMAKEEHLDEE